MRSLTVALLVCLAIAPLGCKRPKAPPVLTTVDAAPELASTVNMADPGAAEQLISGFHQVESKAWRWTAREFVLVLRPPAGGAQLGAALQVNLSIPAVVIDKLSKVTLTPSIGETALTPETYSKPGDYVYSADVPAGLLKAGAVKVRFLLDRAIPPTGNDLRELGIVVSRVGLKLK